VKHVEPFIAEIAQETGIQKGAPDAADNDHHEKFDGPEKVKRTRAQKGHVVRVQTACQRGVHGAEAG
jgi:hypothetical protein